MTECLNLRTPEGKACLYERYSWILQPTHDLRLELALERGRYTTEMFLLCQLLYAELHSRTTATDIDVADLQPVGDILAALCEDTRIDFAAWAAQFDPKKETHA